MRVFYFPKPAIVRVFLLEKGMLDLKEQHERHLNLWRAVIKQAQKEGADFADIPVDVYMALGMGRFEPASEDEESGRVMAEGCSVTESADHD